VSGCIHDEDRSSSFGKDVELFGLGLCRRPRSRSADPRSSLEAHAVQDLPHIVFELPVDRLVLGQPDRRAISPQHAPTSATSPASFSASESALLAAIVFSSMVFDLTA